MPSFHLYPSLYESFRPGEPYYFQRSCGESQEAFRRRHCTGKGLKRRVVAEAENTAKDSTARTAILRSGCLS